MNNEKIIDRIKKLLAMATHDRGNHYECEVAMKMAHRLMAEHKISHAGFYVGLSEKLREQKEEILQENENYALVIANETKAITEFAQKTLSPKKAHQHRDRKLEHNSLQAGFEKGNEFEINSALQ